MTDNCPLSLARSRSLFSSLSLSLTHPHSQPCSAHALSASHPLHRSVQRFRGRLVLEAHRHCVSLNYRLESNEEEANRPTSSTPCRPRAKRDQLERFSRILPARQGQNLAVTVVYVPHSLDSSSLRGLVSSGRIFVMNTRAQRKLLHNWIELVIVMQRKPQIRRKDGPTWYS